jgi:hypothetical protein
MDEMWLSSAMHGLAERDDVPSAPIEQLLRRAHRARQRRSASAVATPLMVGTLAASAGVLISNNLGQPTDLAPVPVALAAESTAETSFHFRVSMIGTTTAGSPSVVTQDGGYDPVNEVGYIESRTAEGTYEERHIRHRCYLRDRVSEQWERHPEPCKEFDAFNLAAGQALGKGSDPKAMLEQLKSLGSVRYLGRNGTGASALDTYSFSYDGPMHAGVPNLGRPAVRFTGTVKIAVHDQLITEVRYTRTAAADHKAVGAMTTVVIRLDSFGTPVTVPVPAS